MKLKVLPPTLRKNNHYFVVDVVYDGVLDKDQLVDVIWDGCIRFCGELATSDFNLWVMRFVDIDGFLGYSRYRAVVRFQRGFEGDIRAALACINNYRHSRISLIVRGIGGTVKSCVDKYF